MSDVMLRDGEVWAVARAQGHSRAVNYRQRAEQLRDIAEMETFRPAVRDNLLSLAAEYERLAGRLD